MPETIPTPPDTFANPHILCTTCQQQVTNVTSPGLVNTPCGHTGTDDVCPSWSPVDGCICTTPHRAARSS